MAAIDSLFPPTTSKPLFPPMKSDGGALDLLFPPAKSSSALDSLWPPRKRKGLGWGKDGNKKRRVRIQPKPKTVLTATQRLNEIAKLPNGKLTRDILFNLCASANVLFSNARFEPRDYSFAPKLESILYEKSEEIQALEDVSITFYSNRWPTALVDIQDYQFSYRIMKMENEFREALPEGEFKRMRYYREADELFEKSEVAAGNKKAKVKTETTGMESLFPEAEKKPLF